MTLPIASFSLVKGLEKLGNACTNTMHITCLRKLWPCLLPPTIKMDFSFKWLLIKNKFDCSPEQIYCNRQGDL